ncbi:phage terminase large subunit [Mannheimia haemolytica]|nr:phage terminase large subunit [Mannheimia haemolytica]MDW0867651.1 phage terminase large subunit [Mannheimia haemolytica]
MKAQIELPPKLLPVFAKDYRYKGAYGGRGSGKTRAFAKMSAVSAYKRAMRGESGVILCGREFMNSLEESSLEEVKQAIKSEPFLANFFDVGEKYVRTKDGRISYVFSGLRHNLDSIKSKARILIAWIDEAETVSETAWRKLIPTVRENNSEIWVTWNPENRGSATDTRFRQNPPENSCIIEMSYQDNPWFPDVLEQERLNDKQRLDDATYRWIWDSARPESISYLKRHGLPRIIGVEKWKGSVEDGIEHIKSYGKVFIHPRCQQTLNEFRLYSYKTDRLSGDVLPVVIDAHNHFIDALRYALTPLMQVKSAKGVLL